MTNGEMENECTWDFGSLAEDFEFSQDAWRRGFTSGRIHGIVREQSPTNFRDFLKQRRRWFMGIRDIVRRPRSFVERSLADGIFSIHRKDCTVCRISPSISGSSECTLRRLERSAR